MPEKKHKQSKPKDLARYLENWRGERDSVFLYHELSKIEKNASIAKVYQKLSEAENKHAKVWERKIHEVGGVVPADRLGLRPRVLAALARLMGPQFVIPIISTMEYKDRTSYDNQDEARAAQLPRDERSHARLLRAIDQSGSAGMEGGALARLEGRHRSMRGNALRAAVLGANDGLVSNMSLIMGVAGASLSGHVILVTGFAGLLAGACSMALGEWLSVQSSRELYTKQIAVEREELIEAPKEEEEELALIYEAKGISKEEARKLAAAIIKDESKALATLSREELGIDPESLGGSAWEAAWTSFVLFAMGAIIPVVPFLFLQGQDAVVGSLLFSSIGLFVIGGAVTLFTGQKLFYSGFRQLGFGLAASGITFVIGRLIGVAIT